MDHSPKFLLLKEFPILNALSEKELTWLTERVSFRKYQKGETIYEEGQEGKNMYLVEKGSIKLCITASCGKILIKDIVHKHSIFGENIFTDDSKRKEFTLPINGEAQMFILKREDILHLIQQNPAFANDMIQTILQRLKIIERRMENFIFKKAKSRIVDFIVQTGKIRGIKIGMDEWLINHGMSHKEIAYLTDTSRQTVARVLGELKRENLIHFSTRKPSKILIRNLVALTS